MFVIMVVELHTNLVGDLTEIFLCNVLIIKIFFACSESHKNKIAIFFVFVHIAVIIYNSDVPGLDFSGFGQARAFMYRASGRPGFSLSGFELFSGFSKV